MKDIREMNLDEIKALEDSIKARKAELKETAKASKKATANSIIAEVTEMINDRTLQLGMDVVVLYGSKNEEVVGKLVGVLSTDKKSLTVESTAFKSTKDGDDSAKRRYVDKSRFVRIAD